MKIDQAAAVMTLWRSGQCDTADIATALGTDPEPPRGLQGSRRMLMASILAGAVSISIYVGFIAWGLG